MSRMYQKIFSYEKFDIDLAFDGEEGLKKAREGKPNLILLDIMMPKMNGLEVLTRLKQDGSTQNIPVIILTNLAGSEDAKEAVERGAIKYIIKSEYAPNQIVEMIQETISSLR